MENENQSNSRFILFLVLSALIFLGWSYANDKLFPQQKPKPGNAPSSANSQSTQAPVPVSSPVAVAAASGQSPNAPLVATLPITEARDIKVVSDLWQAVFSNTGAVLNEWKMVKLADGKLLDADKGGVTLVSAQHSQEFGGSFRFFIPSDKQLETDLNAARFSIDGGVSSDLTIASGETKELGFRYDNNGISARKKIIFKGFSPAGESGYNFDFQAEVTRNGQPVEAYVVIGPNFGDQSVTEVSTYKHAPQISYAVGTRISREQGTDIKNAGPKPIGDVAWAAVDDNYFAMALVPPQSVPAVGLNVQRLEKHNGKDVERNYVSVALRVQPGQVNHIYAGPKAIDTLEQVSLKFGLGNKSAGLDDIVSYGLLDFVRWMVKPIARFMLWALRQINLFTHNWGWSIVALTVLLNMFFFPLRWRSSVMMKRAAAMQPRMKELQDEMRRLDKNDPRVMELQRKQLELMKEGNPLMGCLPLLLQMPFFMAVFAILTVSIEVRHAPFFGWLKDLSAPDPYWLLPIIMCVTMIAQTALTPTTADPVQKKVSYIMPVILTYFFFVSAPAGLVLYWMVGNLVGVGQQFIINKVTGSTPPSGSTPAVNAPKSSAQTGKKKNKEALAN